MIKIGILGYGNLGKGVETLTKQYDDMELVGIFTRRNPEDLAKATNSKIYSVNELINFKDKIDVLILCGGSKSDIPIDGPTWIKDFNTIDAYDTHTDIPEYYKKIDTIAKENNKIAFIGMGWDPGLFSMMRIMFDAILPNSQTYCFWGRGLSQGHSDAARTIDGVIDAVQYTIPIEETVNRIKSGETPNLSTREKHIREVFVVAEDNADKNKIANDIKSIPNYYVDYDTTVNFISMEELDKNHRSLFHQGEVIASTLTGENNKQILGFNLKLDSNPEGTACVMVSYARAVKRFMEEEKSGAFTNDDIPLSYVSKLSKEELLKKI